MQRRLLAIALMLATIVQGTALAYATTLGRGVDHAMTHACDGHSPTAARDGVRECPGCPAHGSILACAAHCAVSSSVAVPMTPPSLQRAALLAVLVADPGVGPFAEYDAPHPLRPPIV
jgi:hypothetical protein